MPSHEPEVPGEALTERFVLTAVLGSKPDLFDESGDARQVKTPSSRRASCGGGELGSNADDFGVGAWLADMPTSRLDDLLPWNWTATSPTTKAN